AADEDVALTPRVRPVRAQAVQRIDEKWQRLQIELDPIDRFRGDVFADGGDREDRLALVYGLVGQRRLWGQRRAGYSTPLAATRRQGGRGQYRPDSRHLQPRPGVGAAP